MNADDAIVMTVTYAITVQTDGEGWRAQYGEVVAFAPLPEAAVAGVMEMLATRMRGATE